MRKKSVNENQDSILYAQSQLLKICAATSAIFSFCSEGSLKFLSQNKPIEAIEMATMATTAFNLGTIKPSTLSSIKKKIIL